MDLQTFGPGRPPLKKTLAQMRKMLTQIEKNPHIQSARLAKLVGIDSLRCSVLARRLEARGLIVVAKDGRTLSYRMAPKGAS